MASTHKSLRSGTANKRPTTSIADGQIALNTNTTSPGLFFKDSTGATIIKVGPVHVGTTAPNASPAAGGSAGNSIGEIWLDTSLTPVGVKIWNGSAFVNATPIGSTTVQGLLELATSAETQAGSDTDRAVTPAGLQSKVSDSTSTTSSTTIASSTAVKSAYDLANAALPKSGGTVTGNLEIGTTGSLSFEGATADAFETTIAVVDPTADRTITLPDTTGTIVTTGDTGTVTSTMIADGTIVDGDISASAEIAVSKLADGAARQLLQTDAAGTGVEWASNIDVPGTLDVTSTATFDSIASHPLGSAAAPTLTFTGDTNTGIYSPGADQVAISTNGVRRFQVGSDGTVNLFGANKTPSGGGNSVVYSTDTQAVDVGGSIAFGGYYIGTSSDTEWAQIAGRKENSTSGNYAGYLQFSTRANGGSTTERLRITSAGLVGIGTSSVTNSLHVVGSADTVARLAATSDTNLTFSETTANKHWNIKPSGGDFYFQYSGTAYNSGYSSLLTIKNTGNVGIGTSSPSEVLTVSGKIQATTEFKSETGNDLRLNAGSANRDIFMQVNGSTLMTVQGSTGRVGIGSTAPLYRLQVSHSASAVCFGESSSVATVIGTNAAGNASQELSLRGFPLTFTGNGGAGSEAARIDSSGRLLVGTSTAPTVSDAQYGLLRTQGNTSSANGFGVFSIGRGQAPASITSGSELGHIYFTANDGSGYAAISAYSDATGGSGDYPGRLVFSTTADGASSPTERMRITSDGYFKASNNSTYATASPDYHQFNQSAASQWALGVFNRHASQPFGVTIQYSNAAPNGTTNTFLLCGDTTADRVQLRSNGGIANYSANNVNLSDINTKKDISLAAGTWDCLKEWEIVNFRYKDQPDDADLNMGVIAQQVAESCPEVITVFEEAKDDQPEKLGIKEQQMYWMAIKALQEAQVRIEQLEAKVAALESA